MAKLTLNPILGQYASVTALNVNNGLTEVALENTLSLDGTLPNSMSASLDLNGNRILNVAVPTNPTDVVRVQELTDIVAGTSTAALTPFTPSGNIIAINVQDAIEEVDAEKAGLALNNTFTGSNTFNANVGVPDNIYFSVGASDDCRFLHVTGNNYIDNRTGTLNVQNNTASQAIKLQTQDSGGVLRDGITIGGSTPDVTLHYGGVPKLHTSSTGFYSTAATTETSQLQLGLSRSGNGTSIVDLIGDATYTNYGLRIARDNGGANASSLISHKGTGNLQVQTVEAGAIDFQTTSVSRGVIHANGGFVWGNPTGASQGAGSINAESLYVNGVAVLTALTGAISNGFWTPTLLSGAASATFSNMIWMKAGKQVTISGEISGLITPAASALIISSLPYTPNAVQSAIGGVLSSNVTYTGVSISARIFGGNLDFRHSASAGAGSSVLGTDVGVTGAIHFTLTYLEL